MLSRLGIDTAMKSLKHVAVTAGFLGLLAAVAVGCAGAQDTGVGLRGDELPPTGFGTLRQDDISIPLRTESFSIGVIPLDESIIRLLAPDTYASMHRLLDSKQEEIVAAGAKYGSRDAVAFLVSFYGREARARFDPEALTITGQNRLFRPVGILPISPSFGDRQLNQRETATAVFVYESGIRLADPFTVSYNGISSDQWEQNLRKVERERTAVAARAAAARRPGTPP
jgi:hypothetical protein